MFHFFRLCCSSITSPSSHIPAVTIGSISTIEHQGRFTDVVLPGQSFLANVPGSILHCISDQRLSKFSLLPSVSNKSAYSSKHDPWTYLDSFGRSAIFKSLLSIYKAVISGPKAGLVRMTSGDVSSVVDEPPLKTLENLKESVKVATSLGLLVLLEVKGRSRLTTND